MTNRWAVLGLLCFARISMGLHFQSVAAVAPLMMASLDLTYAQLGLLIGLSTVPGIVLSLPGGLLGARFGDRTTILTGLGLIVIGGALFANAASFAGALLARLIGGAGGVILNLQLTKITTDWFMGKELSAALAILLSTWPLGLALALATLGTLATVTSWQTAMYATAAYAALALLLVALLYREPAAASDAPKRPLWTISSRELGLVALGSLSWMFLNAGLIVFMTFAPTLLMERGRSLAEAGSLVSLTSLISIGSLPLAGYLVDRTRRGNAFIIAGASASAAAILLLSLGEPALLWIVMFGIVLAAPVPSVVALPSEILRPENRSTGFGVWGTVYHFGMLVVPPIAGLLLDMTQSARTSVIFAGVLWLMIIPPLLVFRTIVPLPRSPRPAPGAGRA